MRIGVHCSVKNGFAGAVEDARRLGCETLQMFSRSPRMWRARLYDEEEFVEFRRAREKAGMSPIVVHCPYLPNLCTSRRELFERSCEVLQADLKTCARLGAEYLVVHPGAWSPEAAHEEGIAQIIEAFRGALKTAPPGVTILLENMAGGGRRVGSRFEEIRAIRDGVGKDERLAVCFDTCHAIGAGYDIHSEEGVEETLAEFRRHLPLDIIKVFHVNDSKAPLASHRDRHEHLGKGTVGLEGFRALLGRPEFADRAGILETPKDSPRADPRNLRVLRGLLSGASARVPGRS